MLERHVESYLRGVVTKLGGKAYKFTSPGRRSVPDRLILLPVATARALSLPKSFFIELKATGTKATAAQLREHKRLHEVDEVVLVIDSKEKVDDVFRVGFWWRNYISPAQRETTEAWREIL